jgi:hypothetical protein
MAKWLVKLAGLGMAAVAAGGLLAGIAYADSSLRSNNYQFIETSLGNGGLIQSGSAHYRASESIGDTAVGNTKSDNYQVETGSQSTDDPGLSFSIDNGNASFSSGFSAGQTATATATFSVRDYTSYGYAVQIMGDTPTNAGHSIPGMSTTGPSQTGEEQFGINLVANTSPTSFGANPTQVPDTSFSYGQAAANYDTPNKFRFVSGETIATSPKSSGVTSYTISYIVNVKSLTPGGQYSSHQSLVCVATF